MHIFYFGYLLIYLIKYIVTIFMSLLVSKLMTIAGRQALKCSEKYLRIYIVLEVVMIPKTSILF